MKFKEYNYVDKDGKSNCVLRSLSKLYNREYNLVYEGLMDIAKELGYENYNEVEVFEKYMKNGNTEAIDYGKDIQIKDLKLDEGKYIVFCYDKKELYHMVYIDNNTLYDKDDKSLDLYTIKIYKFNELELYKKWFKNYSFFDGNSFVIDEIDFLFKAINIMGYNLQNTVDLKSHKLSNAEKEEIIELVKVYYKNHNINLNIDELIENGNLILVDNEKKKSNFSNVLFDGNSDFDTEKNMVVAKVTLEYTLLDSLVIIHELSHNRNQPIGERKLISDILTESLAYTNELIACDELLDQNDKCNYFIGFQKMIYEYCYNLYDIYKIILTYKYQNDITEDKYNNQFKDNNYKDVMNEFKLFIDKKESIYRLSYYILGFVLSIYMFTKYKKDNNFFNNIEELNDKLNELNLVDCLNIINIKNLNDLLNKFNDSLKEFIEYFNEINEEKIITKNTN